MKAILFWKRKISIKELYGDFVLFMTGGALGMLFMFFFDIHHCLYPGHTCFPPDTFLLTSMTPYIISFFVGGILGIFVFKIALFCYALMSS
ncbi:MAG: hypothetical protein QW735_02780 [archaeon]